MLLTKNIPLKNLHVDWRNKILQRLNDSGYRKMDSSSTLIFERGSFLGSFTGVSPSQWKVKLEIKSNEFVEVILKINTFGQIVTQRERAFWETEISSFEYCMKNQEIPIEISQEIASKSQKENIYVGVGIVTSAILCTAIGKTFFDSPLLGMFFGVILGFVLADRILKFRK